MSSSEIQPAASVAFYRQATDVASVCSEIVKRTAIEIQGRNFVPVEGWTSIAVAHGCIATIRSVEELPHGIKAVAEIRKISDGIVITAAEGYVGDDEPVWFGGPGTRWNRRTQREEEVIHKKRPDYAIRAMAQTRAISRACRTAFSHVVVMMANGLQTTPAEEMTPDPEDIPLSEKIPESEGGRPTKDVTPKPEQKKTAPEVPRDESTKLRAQFEGGKWKAVQIHFGKNKGIKLGDLEAASLKWYVDDWAPKPIGNRPLGQDDLMLRAALDVAGVEEFK